MTFLTAWKIVVNPWEYEFNANAVSLAIGRKDRGWVTAAANDSQGTGIHLKHTHPMSCPLLCPHVLIHSTMTIPLHSHLIVLYFKDTHKSSQQVLIIPIQLSCLAV